MIENVDRPTEPLNEEGVQTIHNGAMHILENIGIEILNDEARQIFADAGCIVNGENVRFGRDFIMEMVAKAPVSLTWCHAILIARLPLAGIH